MKRSVKKSPPDKDVDTRQRIKVAARQLFAERGVEAVTVREIVAAAGARNGGSLNYYFKTKDGLVLELVSDIIRENTETVLDAFAEFERAGGPKTVREVVAVIITSFKPKIDPSPTAARFLSSLLFTRRRMVREFISNAHFPVYVKLLTYIEQLRPDIPARVMRQRWIYFAWYMVSTRSAYEAYIASGKRTPIWVEFDPIQNLIDTATALLEAPVTHSAKDNLSKVAGGSRRREKHGVSQVAAEAILPH